MLQFRSYWIYSTGLALVWAIVLLLAWTIRGSENAQPTVGLSRLQYRLGINDDCPLRLSATKALGSNRR